MSDLFGFGCRALAAFVLVGCALAWPAPLAGQVAAHRRTLEGHAGSVWSVAIGPSGAILASGSTSHISDARGHSDARDNTVRFWNLSSGKSLGVFELPNSNVRCVVFSPDGHSLAAAGNLGRLRIWDVADPKRTRDFDGPRGLIWTLAFSPDGKTLAAGSSDAVIILFDAKSGDIVSRPPGHAKTGTRALSYTPEGDILVSGGMDNIVKRWDVAKRMSLPDRYAGHKFGIASMAFSPDGKWLATGAANQPLKGTSRPDGGIFIWDFASGEKAAALEGHASEVATMAFHRDGKKLASASEDGTVRIWNIDARKEIAILRDHNGPVRAVTFSPDGKTLATGGDDKMVRLWDVK